MMYEIETFKIFVHSKSLELICQIKIHKNIKYFF